MSKRGRPPGVDSAATKKRIVDVARAEFATRGYAATAMTAVAAEADLAPSAIYHYFGGKTELYEEVFETTVSAIWADLGASFSDRTTLETAVALPIVTARWRAASYAAAWSVSRRTAFRSGAKFRYGTGSCGAGGTKVVVG